MAWMLNPVTGDPMKVTKQQLDDIERSKRVSPTAEVLTSFTKVASSTGGSFLIVLSLLPLVLRQLSSQLPQLAGTLATISQAIKDPSKTADEFGEEMAETLIALPTGFFTEIVGAGFSVGEDIVGPAQPSTPAEGPYVDFTRCQRFEIDLVDIKRKLDNSKGVKKIQGTYAYATKLWQMKKAGCSRPGFVTEGSWNRVPA